MKEKSFIFFSLCLFELFKVYLQTNMSGNFILPSEEIVIIN